MARSFALNKINKQTRSSFKKVKKGAVDFSGKPIAPKTQSWHAGRLAGLKVAKGAYFSGRKQGYSQGRKQGYLSGLKTARFARYGRAF